MTASDPPSPPAATSPPPHRRRPRYQGKYPRRFEEKYKERNPDQFPETVVKVLASGKTPAGMHRPIMVHEVLEVLAIGPGAVVADCTLGYGGHAQHLLSRVQPGGRMIALDTDPIELPKTDRRLRALGFGPEVLAIHRSNYAGLRQVLALEGLPGVDALLADLGVSSMQLDDPARGFSAKFEGPLDMRMNPAKGEPASALLARLGPTELAEIIDGNADEPRAVLLAGKLARQPFSSTTALARAIHAAIAFAGQEERDLAVRRVFQALRIAVNDEFSALETFLRRLPHCLNQGGRVAIITFHSGEDRRVKKAFAEGRQAGFYSEIASEIIRPSPAERQDNPRSTSAKLRWAKRSDLPLESAC